MLMKKFGVFFDKNARKFLGTPEGEKILKVVMDLNRDFLIGACNPETSLASDAYLLFRMLRTGNERKWLSETLSQSNRIQISLHYDNQTHLEWKVNIYRDGKNAVFEAGCSVNIHDGSLNHRYAKLPNLNIY